MNFKRCWIIYMYMSVDQLFNYCNSPEQLKSLNVFIKFMNPCEVSYKLLMQLKYFNF